MEMRHILLPLIAILISRGFMHAVVTTFLPTFIEMESGNLWLAGVSLTLVEIAGVVGAIAAGSLSDTLGRRKVMLYSLVGAPIMLLSFVWIDSWLRFVVLVITGFALLSTTPVMLAIVQENSTNSPSAANGIFMMSSFMARSAIAVIVGLMGDLIGLKATYTLSAFLGFGAIPFILMLPRDNVKK
jgi:FSR family fosmidomycin resistance protein-like MFS transporter